ncbi:hypothetical protein HID58_067483, partial [Brassica napus]
SPLEGTLSLVSGTELPSKKGKTSDKENLPYFQFNQMAPTSRRLYKSYHNPKARDRLLQGLETRIRELELGPVSFPPASKQDPDTRVPDKGTLQVPARRNPKFGPLNRAPFQVMENF